MRDLRRTEPECAVHPVSYAQQRLWFLDQLEPANPLYNVPRATEIEGPLDVSALERSLTALVARHDTLRTTFPSRDGVPVQRVASSLQTTLPVLDLRHVAAADRMQLALELANETAWEPFDLAQGPLFRARLLRLEDSRHLLVLALHHIISDGWSFGVLQRDLWALYRAAVEGTPSSLPDLPAQYADYARRQRERLQGDPLERQVAYWRSRLAGAPPFLDLPADRVRPPTPTNRGATSSLTLPHRLGEELRALSRRERATLFMTLLAAFQVLLGRYTRQTDLVVGSPIAGRLHAQFEGLIGFFVNMLPLRADLSGDPRFRELLERVRESALDAYDHQELPYERLVEELQPPRDPGRTPLFQVIFTLRNTPRPGIETPGLQLRRVELERRTARFDLSLSIAQSSDGLRTTIEYRTDLFDAETISRMLGHYRVLLEAVVADADCRISKLPMLTPPERQRLLVDWNATTRHGTAERMHQIVHAHAVRTPDAIAIVTATEKVTYPELDRRAGRLASHLRGLGVGQETLVAICLDRSIEMVVSLLGILKAGGGYLPLDPTTPQDRLAFMLADADPKVVVSRTRVLDRLPPHPALVVDLDAHAEDIARADAACAELDLRADHLAYVIYTSGSTGRPKGVAVPHCGVANVYSALAALMGLNPSDRVLQLSSLAFDFSLTEIMMALCAGATLHLGTREELVPGEPLAHFLDQHRITAIDITPSTLAVLPRRALPYLRVLALGGEALPAELVRAWSTTPVILNLYGPTEATMISTAHVVEKARLPGLTVPIGRPLPNTRAYVLDPQMEPVPVNVAGELYLGGMGVTRGYLRRPGLTAERFVPDPFSTAGGSRLYRTGDLVRWLPDGTLEFLGRLDRQVKLRGYRIELDEIEATLASHPGVCECAVIVRDDEARNPRLTAYVAPAPGTTMSREELRRFLSGFLPDYMIPQVFVLLAELPHGIGGKVDRKALPAPTSAGLDGTDGRTPPRSPTELLVADVWRQVLGIADIAVDADFFQVGGHSLLATQVISRLNGTLQVELPLMALFEDPTIAGLAQRIARQAESGPRSPAPPVPPSRHRSGASA